MKFFRKLLPFLFFLFISILVIYSWFRFGHIYGGGEVGLPTYNIEGAFERSKFIWWNKVAPGFLVSQSITSTPFFFILSRFSTLGLSPFDLQIFWFFSLIFLMGIGMYLYGLSVFGKEKKIYASISGLFYIFNPYMMVQIWHRFVYSSIFFVAALPYLVLVWRLWIKKRSFFWLFIFQIVNLLAVYSYGTIAFIITLWLLLGLLSVLEELVPWSGKKHFLTFCLRFGLGFGFWLIVNAWWLIPFFSTGPGLLAQQHGIDDNLLTLISISKQTILPYILQLINPFYLFTNSDFGQIYNTFIFKSIPWITFIIIIIGFLYGLKQKKYVKWSILFLTIIFLSKGAAPPFGFLYQWGFSHFFILGIIRNPFEKIGILLPFISSILIVVGLQSILKLTKKYFNNFFSYSIIFIILLPIFVYLWPMFAGKIFGTLSKPNFVEVPISYRQADQFINQQDKNRPVAKQNGRILHLPLTLQEAVTYKWPYGYRGVEDSALLFNSLPSVSHGFNLVRVDDSLTALSLFFNNSEFLNKDKILRILQVFNIEFVVLHKDMDWRTDGIYDPNIAEQILDKLDFLGNKHIFGDLAVYELMVNEYQPRITFSSSFQVIYPNDNMGIWPWLKNETGNFISPGDKEGIDSIIPFDNEIIFPNNSYTYTQYPKNDLLALFINFSNNIDNPSGILNRLSILKNDLSKNNEILASAFLEKLISATKTLFIRNEINVNSESLKLYNSYIEDIFKDQIKNSRIFLYINNSIISDIFQMHLIKLTQLQTTLGEEDKKLASQIESNLKQKLTGNRILPLHSFDTDKLTNRQVNTFQIPRGAAYELSMSNPQIYDLYKPNIEEMNFQINDKIVVLKSIKKDNFISFGQIQLDQGISDIYFDTILSKNLFPDFSKIRKQGSVEIANDSVLMSSSDGGFSFVDIDIPGALGAGSYQFNFGYQIIEGDSFKIQLIQDTDLEKFQAPPSSDEEARNLTEGVVVSAPKDRSLSQEYSLLIPPLNLFTKKATLRILVFQSSGILNNQIKILIKSPKIQRILNDTIFLEKSAPEKIGDDTGEVLEANQKNPTLYTGKVRISSPGFIFLKEAFHPGWSLTLSNVQGTYMPIQHLLGGLYGNAWYVDKSGEYDFKLEFEPQRKVLIGLVLALSSAILLIFLSIIFSIKEKHEN